MPFTYFIVDFAYNPDSDKPLAIFELGDAFYSEYPNKKMGPKQLTPAQYLELDIKQQHKDPVFIQATPSGLVIKSLNDGKLIDTFDKEKPSYLVNELCSSYEKINDLLLNIIANSGQNEVGRELIVHLAYKNLYHYYDWMEQNGRQVKLLNHTSKTLMDAFYNKATLADSAKGSPIFPGTLIIPGWSTINESSIERFLRKYKAEYYIIKPAAGTHAKGVHVVKASQLKETLKNTDNYEVHGLIVQVCHLSKQLKYLKESYYAKSRAIIRVDFLPNNAEPRISIITAFWQLANSPANDSLNDKNVIANMDANPEGALEIDAEDLSNITQEFNRHLPGIIKKMQGKDSPITNEKRLADLNQASLAKALLSFLDAQSICHSYEPNIFSNNLCGMKHFVIDILGLNKELHDWVNYSDDSIEKFVNNATALFCGNKNHRLNNISIASMFKQQVPKILVSAIFTSVSMFLIEDNNSNNSFNIKLLTGVVATTFGSLVIGFVSHPAVTRASQSFFKRTEIQDTGTWGRSGTVP